MTGACTAGIGPGPHDDCTHDLDDPFAVRFFAAGETCVLQCHTDLDARSECRFPADQLIGRGRFRGDGEHRLHQRLLHGPMLTDEQAQRELWFSLREQLYRPQRKRHPDHRTHVLHDTLDARLGQGRAGRGAELGGQVHEHALEVSLGNPLALSELPRALAPEQLTGGRELPAELPLSSRLERAFAARVAELAPGCQTALLIAALNDTDLLGETLHAANMLSGDRVSRGTLGAARLSGLIEFAGDRITFRHPLIRSAIRQAASDAERYASYVALAEAVGGDPDRRAWHRAAAVGAPDEVVACELERAAGRAQQRGNLSAAISALLRAAELSDDPASRARRLLGAAEFGLDSGQTGLAPDC